MSAAPDPVAPAPPAGADDAAMQEVATTATTASRPAPPRAAPTQQATLRSMFGVRAPERPNRALDPAAAAQAAKDDAELRRTAAAAAHALATKKLESSPKKGAKSLGWLDDLKTKAATNSRGVKDVVTVRLIDDVPLSHWKREGGLRCDAARTQRTRRRRRRAAVTPCAQIVSSDAPSVPRADGRSIAVSVVPPVAARGRA